MANLTNGVNLFTVGSKGLDTSVPDLSGLTASQLLDIENNGTGINRQDDESGVYLSLKSTANIDVYVLYNDGSTIGWVNTQTIDITDLDFENGHAIAWRNSTAGTAIKIKFVTTDVDAEIRLLPIKKVLITDETRDDSDLNENFLSWYSNTIEHATVGTVTQTKNYDGYQRRYHDLSTYSIGDTFSFEVDGFVDDAISFVRMVEEFLPTYSYDDSTQKTTISFVIPAGENTDYDTTLDVWHTWWSLGEVELKPLILSINVDQSASAWGNGFAIIVHAEDNYDFSVDWGDNQPIRHYKTGDLHSWTQDNDNSTISFGNGIDLEWENDVLYIHNFYKNVGTYQVKITGVMPSLAFGVPLEFGSQSFYYGVVDQAAANAMVPAYSGTALNQMLVKSKSMITSVDQWGDVVFSNLKQAFARCYNLKLTASDYPKFASGMTSLESMFEMNYNLIDESSNLEKWKTNGVSNMSKMFYMATNFNEDLSTKLVQELDDAGNVISEWQAWNTEDVYSFKGMFAGGKGNWGRNKFNNSSITNWNLSNVGTLTGMFAYSEFDQSLDLEYHAIAAFGNDTEYESWSFRNQSVNDLAINFDYMFASGLFNSSIQYWILPGSASMRGLFYSNGFFNQYIRSGSTSQTGPYQTTMGYYAPFDTRYITNARSMFQSATAFNQDVSSWFPKIGTGTGNTSIGSSVNQTQQMFKSATAFNNGDFNYNMTWDLSNVSIVSEMFASATSFDGNVEGFDVSNTDSFNSMFYNARSFTGINNGYPLGKYNVTTGWDTSSGNRFDQMFQNCISLQVSECHFDMSNGFAGHSMFKNCSSIGNFTWWGTWGDGATGFGLHPTIQRDPTGGHYMMNIISGCSNMSQTSVEGLLAKWNSELPDIVGSIVGSHNYHSAQQYGMFEGLIEDLPVQWRDSVSQTDRDQLVAKGWWINDNGINTIVPDPEWVVSWPSQRFQWTENSTIGDHLTSSAGIKDLQGNFLNLNDYTIEMYEITDSNGVSYPLNTITVTFDPNNFGVFTLHVGDLSDIYYGASNSVQLYPRIKITHNSTGTFKTHPIVILPFGNEEPSLSTLGNGIHSIYNMLDTRGYGAPSSVVYPQSNTGSGSSLIGTDVASNSSWVNISSGKNNPFVTIPRKWFNRYVNGSYSGNTYGPVYLVDIFPTGNFLSNGSAGNKQTEDVHHEILAVKKTYGHWKYTGSLWSNNQTHPYEGGYFKPVTESVPSQAADMQRKNQTITQWVTGHFRVVDDNITNHATRYGHHKYIEYTGPKVNWPSKLDNKSSQKWRKACEFEIYINVTDAWDGTGSKRQGSKSKTYKISYVLQDMGIPG